MPRFIASIQAKVRTYHGQQFTGYWFLGKYWNGLSPTEVELSAEELKAFQDHQAAGFPIQVLEFVEISETPPAGDPIIEVAPPVPPVEIPVTAVPPPPPAKTASANKPPWA